MRSSISSLLDPVMVRQATDGVCALDDPAAARSTISPRRAARLDGQMVMERKLSLLVTDAAQDSRFQPGPRLTRKFVPSWPPRLSLNARCRDHPLEWLEGGPVFSRRFENFRVLVRAGLARVGNPVPVEPSTGRRRPGQFDLDSTPTASSRNVSPMNPARRPLQTEFWPDAHGYRSLQTLQRHLRARRGGTRCWYV